jgi:AraC-like DNA-binding protein
MYNSADSERDLESAQTEFVERLQDVVNADGIHETEVPGLRLIRASSPMQEALPGIYQPSICMVAQGRKRAITGDSVINYGPLRHLVASMTLPVSWQVVQASVQEPYFCLQLDLDVSMIQALRAKVVSKRQIEPVCQHQILFADRTDRKLLDTVLRLLRLLDDPGSIEILGPLIKQEFYYHVLNGKAGSILSSIYLGDRVADGIYRAIEFIKTNYANSLRTRSIASVAYMSESALHRHFKAATALSPLQFQKRLRLHEARRMMLVEGMTAAAASYQVGYESPSHFNNDYRRLFNSTPARQNRDVG